MIDCNPSARRVLAGVTALLFAAPAMLGAQARPAQTDTVPDFLLEGVTVTSTRAPEVRGRTVQKVEVIGASQIRATVADEMTDALKKNSTVDVIQYPGLLAGVGIRGFRPQFSGINPRTLILVDGRPAGTANLATLDLASAERIEVLRGPASALYGSSAMGGVVNVITRRSTGGLSGQIAGSIGTWGRDAGAVGPYSSRFVLGGGIGRGFDFDLSLGSAGQRSGYRVGQNRLVGDDFVIKTLQAGGTDRLQEITPDTVISFSEYDYRTASARLGYELGRGWRIEGRGSRFLADQVQNPGDLNAASDGRSLKDLDRVSGEMALTGVLGAHALSIRGYQNRELNEYYNRAFAPNFVNLRNPIRVYGAQLQDVVTVGAATVTAGLDYTASRSESESFSAEGVRRAPWSPDSGIHSAAGFAQARFHLFDDRLTAMLGGRLDRITFEVLETELLTTHAPNTERHTAFNPSAGLLYAVGGGVQLRANTGRAFVTPDAFNVAGYAISGAGSGLVSITRGNPELRPESSVSWEIGAVLTRPVLGVEADLTYFQTDVRDRISSQTLPGTGRTPAGDSIRATTTYINVDEAEVRGLEASLGYDVGARAGYSYSLRLFANSTHIFRAEEVLGGNARRIQNVAPFTLVSGLQFDDRSRFDGRLSGRYVGAREDTDFSDFARLGTVRYPSFLIVDLSAGARLADRYRLGLSVANLTDENYYEIRGYNRPGRSLRLDLGITF